MKCLHCGGDTSNPKFCGQSCAASYNNKFSKIKEKPVCLTCKKTLPRGRKYCSNKCQALRTKNLIKENIIAGDKVTHQQIRKYLIELHGPLCMDCGWSKVNPVTKKVPIEIDHIDGNAQNNKLDNVRLLCPNCQSLTSTYKALNKGNGRYSRRERYRSGKSY